MGRQGSKARGWVIRERNFKLMTKQAFWWIDSSSSLSLSSQNDSQWVRIVFHNVIINISAFREPFWPNYNLNLSSRATLGGPQHPWECQRRKFLLRTYLLFVSSTSWCFNCRTSIDFWNPVSIFRPSLSLTQRMKPAISNHRHHRSTLHRRRQGSHWFPKLFILGDV